MSSLYIDMACSFDGGYFYFFGVPRHTAQTFDDYIIVLSTSCLTYHVIETDLYFDNLKKKNQKYFFGYP